MYPYLPKNDKSKKKVGEKMGSIVLLDEHTVNKIAAGEVVDRPASIVKELVENSIDAQATHISVEIKKGGISYIKIIDDGIGFGSDDIALAFERHATSKIRKEEDLLHIMSMGFRGEALASIAAIAKVTLTTKSKEEEMGQVAKVEAGQILEIEPAAAKTGTKIEIRDVFYNVPARFKFLKKDYTEAGYIEDVMIRIALANPSISFEYINNGKTILQTTGNGDLKSVIYDIFGKEIYENLIPISYAVNEITVQGVIGLPRVSRSTRMHQFTYINNRYIKDKTVNAALDRACEQKYAINKFAFAVVNIKMNPVHIDVNVHPAKLEVKFDDEAKVFDAIYYAVRSAIEKNNKETSPFSTIRAVENGDKIEQISKDLVNHGMLKDTVSHSLEKKFDFGAAFVSHSPSKVEEPEENTYVTESVSMGQTPSTEIINKPEEAQIAENTLQEESKGQEVVPLFQSEEMAYENVALKSTETVLYRYIGQVFDTYILIQIKEKMYIIDQHAAHERMLFEQIKEAYYAKEKQTQMLLIPILVELTTKEMNMVEQNEEMFEQSGFLIEEFGDNTIKISGVPNIGYDIEYQSMFKDMIDDLLGAPKTQKDEKEFRFLATLACKAAVKGKMKLSEQELINLIDNMVKLDNPFTCPHGRPTAWEISKYDIERRFLRK